MWRSLTSPVVQWFNLDSTSRRLQLFIDLAALTGIAWFAWRYAGFFLRDDLYLYGDHPGQFYRLWLLTQITWPEESRFIGWSPYWFAGWPELQFYPPGFALLGWLIWTASFQQLSLFVVYQAVVFTSFFLPAIGFYLLLARGLQDRLAGLAAAWLAMTQPFILGGVMGVVIGLLGERLAFGLIPLAILSGLWLVQAGRRRFPWLVTGLLIAAILLMHPYQAILPVGVLGLYILFQGQERWLRLRWLVAAALLGLGLTAFWWLPLGTRSHLFVPVVEAPLVEINSNLAKMWFSEAAVLLVVALLGTLSRRDHRRWLPLAIGLGGLVMLGMVYFSYFILTEKLHIFAFSSVRLITAVTFVFLFGLAMGLSELAWLGVRLLRRWQRGAWGAPLLLAIPYLLYSQVTADHDFAKWMSKWQPGTGHTPIFLKEAEAKYGLEPIWQQMAATPGRILYTSHYGMLFDIPTSLKAITPIRSGREIIGGVFTHRMPVSTYLWTGEADRQAVWGKVEAIDDESLAGMAWEEMSQDFFYDLARRFNVSMVVATATDVRARAFLDTASRFRPAWSNDLLTLYELRDYETAWAEASSAGAVVERYDRQAIDIAITDARPGAILSVKVSYYDLWQAEAETFLPVESDAYGLMQIPLPPGSYTLRLRYVLGWPERLGEIISLLTGLGSLALIAAYWEGVRWPVRRLVSIP